MSTCAAHATIQDPAGNRKPDKRRAAGRIDGMQTLAKAYGIAVQHETTEIENRTFAVPQ